MLGSNDLDKSSKFYDSIFTPLKIKKVTITERYIGYARKNEPDNIEFYITKPYNKELANKGNGTMVSFKANSANVVDEFHAIGLKNGANDEGSPGVRSDGNYYAYIRDPDGNKICAKYNSNK